jgi:hypothetical protein
MFITNQQVLDRVRDKMAYGRYHVSYADATYEQRSTIDRRISRPVCSSDGVVLVHNETRVYTNNLDRGVVDLSDLSFEWNPNESRWVPWFDVQVDTDYKGNPTSEKVMQSDDRVATR